MEIGAKRVNIGTTLHGLREAQPNSQVYHFRRITYINLRGCVTAVSFIHRQRKLSMRV